MPDPLNKSFSLAVSRESTLFATANVGGIALYTWLNWRIIENIRYEQRTAEFADGFVFLFTAFPVLAFFVTADFIWVAVMANQHRRHRDSMGAALFGIVAIAAWIATFFGLRYVF